MRFPDTPTILDADAAEELLRFFDKYPVLKIAGFSLWTFDEMTPEAAKVIADSGMDILFLDPVKAVSPEVIRILAESQVSYLSLGGSFQLMLRPPQDTPPPSLPSAIHPEPLPVAARQQHLQSGRCATSSPPNRAARKRPRN